MKESMFSFQRLLLAGVAGLLSVSVAMGDTYSKVTSVSQLIPGASYLLVYETVDGSSNPIAYANTATLNSGKLSPTSSTPISDNNITAPSGAVPVVLGVYGGYWTLNMVGSTNYLAVSGSSGSENLVYLTILNSNAVKWDISFEGEQVSVRNINHPSFYILYNTSANVLSFKANTTAVVAARPIALYKKDEAIASMVQNNGAGDFWATFSDLSHNIFFPKANATVYKVQQQLTENVIVALPEQTISGVDGYVVPAGMGVLVRSKNNNSTVSYSTTTVSFDTSGENASFFDSNILHAANGAISQVPGHQYYKLACGTYNSTTGECTNLGFYFGASNGAAYTPGSGKAYLDWYEPGSPAPAHFTLEELVGEENNTTSIKAEKKSVSAVKFVEQGQLRILYAGVVYDVMGNPIKTK